MLIDEITKYLSHHKIAILGFGLEGHSTYRFLRRLFPQKEIALADKDDTKLYDFITQSDDKRLVAHGGDNYLAEVAQNGYTLVFKSPGIPLKDIEKYIPQDHIESQAGLFLKLYKRRIIGITGTKGKSTTANLIYETMKAQGFDVVAVGNMGKPVLDLVFEDVPNRWYVFEMSSHMLETVSESPRFAVLLNIYEEHLDHYRSFSEYAEAKLNLVRYQTKNDFAVFSKNVLEFCGNIPGAGTPLLFDEVLQSDSQGVFIQDGRIVFQYLGNPIDICSKNLDRKLLGQHNLLNIMACLTILKALNVENLENALKAISEFKGLEHRMELVGEFSGITFYNDSISTIPQAAICAVNAIGNVDTLIIGGMDRGIDYSELINFIALGSIRNVICLPNTGHMIHQRLKQRNGPLTINILDVYEMKSAVEEAFKVTKKGSVCILSPAAASYGFYKNFEERGKVFKNLVRAHE